MSQRNKRFDLDYTVGASLLSVRKLRFSAKDSNYIHSAMKYSVARVGLSFVAVFLLGFVFQGTSANEDLYHEDKVAEKNPLRLDKRSVSKNATHNMPDILKRLKALEEK